MCFVCQCFLLYTSYADALYYKTRIIVLSIYLEMSLNSTVFVSTLYWTYVQLFTVCNKYIYENTYIFASLLIYIYNTFISTSSTVERCCYLLIYQSFYCGLFTKPFLIIQFTHRKILIFVTYRWIFELRKIVVV